MPLYLSSNSTNQIISKIYIDSSDGIQRAAKEAWLADESGVNRKIFSMGIPISQLPIGSVVKDVNTKYNDAVIRFIVGHQDVSVVRLITERIITLKCFDAKEPTNPNSQKRSYGNNRYAQSNIDQWLNSNASPGEWYSARHEYDAPPTRENVSSGYNEYDQEAGFLSHLGQGMYNALLDSTIYVGTSGATIVCKVRLLSRTEVFGDNEASTPEGDMWDYFQDPEHRIAYPTDESVNKSEYKNSKLDSSQPWRWSLLTQQTGHTYFVRNVLADKTLGEGAAYVGYFGIRPAVFLPPDTLVSGAPDSDGAYILQF